MNFRKSKKRLTEPEEVYEHPMVDSRKVLGDIPFRSKGNVGSLLVKESRALENTLKKCRG